MKIILGSSLKYFIKSFFFFTSNLFIKRDYDIVFYYPIHFNRGKKGENQFFESFYEICKKNDISYLVIEEPELFSKNDYRRNDYVVPFDLVFFIILVFRKLIPLKKFENFQEREWFIAKILKPIFFTRFTFKNYIVLSQSMVGFFRGLDDKAKLYDYQHGVLTSTHSGYVTEDHQVPDNLKLNRVNVLVYGDGFRKVLLESTKDDYYKKHAITVGQYIKSRMIDNYKSRSILFALQFKDFDVKTHEKILERVISFLKRGESLFEKYGIKLYLKNHPRFNHNISLDRLKEFSFVEFKEIDLFDVIESSFLQVTLSSTSVFEAAARGIPTLLIKNDDLPHELNPYFFDDDYYYPIKTKIIDEIIIYIENYLKDEEKYRTDLKEIYSWYQNFYSKIDEKSLISILKKDQK